MSDPARVSDALRRAVREGGDTPVRIAVAVAAGDPELDSGMPRRERLRALQQSFDVEAVPVVEAIEAFGGSVDTVAWANHVVYATVVGRHVDRLALVDKVQGVDIAGWVDAGDGTPTAEPS